MAKEKIMTVGIIKSSRYRRKRRMKNFRFILFQAPFHFCILSASCQNMP